MMNKKGVTYDSTDKCVNYTNENENANKILIRLHDKTSFVRSHPANYNFVSLVN